MAAAASLARGPTFRDACLVQTYSHFLVAALAGERLRRRTRVRVTAFLAGSVLPDVPLLLLTFWYLWWRDRLAAGNEPLFGPTYDRLYFENPLWIASTSLFHAPLLIAGMIAVGQWARERGRPWGGTLFWLGLGCALHTALDIPTHGGDGPLLLFPLDWRLRFESPISYWEADRHASVVAGVEHALDLAIVAYFAVLGVRRWRHRGAGPGEGRSRRRRGNAVGDEKGDEEMR